MRASDVRYAANIIALSVVTTPLIALGIFPGLWRRNGDRPPDAASDLERRRPVWRALSELYLDTELDAGDQARIPSVLRESGYSADQLEEILYRELHPVLHANQTECMGDPVFWAEECRFYRKIYEPLGCGAELADYIRCQTRAEVADCQEGPVGCEDDYSACESHLVQRTGCNRAPNDKMEEECKKSGRFAFTCFSDDLPANCNELPSDPIAGQERALG